MKYLELWEPLVNVNEKFDEPNIPNIHVKYVNEMIFGEYNIQPDGPSKAMAYDGEVIIVTIFIFCNL